MKCIACIIFSLCILTNCGGNSLVGGASERTSNEQQASSSSQLQHTIVRGVLGGALATTIAEGSLSLPPDIVVGPSESLALASVSSDRNPLSYTFTDSASKLILDILVSNFLGEGSSSVIKGNVISFSSVTIDIGYYGFNFTDSCGDAANLTGRMECRFSGTYDRNMIVANGTVDCVTGTFTKSESLLYLSLPDTDDQEGWQINTSVSVTIDGDPFDLASYEFSDQFDIDGEDVSIENVIDADASCEEESF